MKSASTNHPVRRDLNRFFGCWLLIANFLWLATPWLETLAPTWGAVWLWALAIPGFSLAALNPERSLRLASAAIVLSARAATGLTSPCRFRVKRAG